jgi:hypothetical protein
MASDQRKKERKKSVERKKREFCGTESSFCMASDQKRNKFVERKKKEERSL